MRQYLALFLLAVLLLFAGCSLPGSGKKLVEGCPSDNNPVCGTNGQTYMNACLAQAAGVQVAHNGPCTAPNSAACSDGDGGKDIFTAGSVLSGGDYSDDSCKDAAVVKEYYCENGAVSMAELPCPGGYACVNGACTVTPCTDTDSGAIAEMKGTASASGASHTDSCASAVKVLEYYCSGGSVLSREMDCGNEKQCSDGACVPYMCTDSDNGQVADTFGTATFGTTSNNDSCYDANTVKEYYCEDGQMKSKNIACGAGKSCQNGRCTEVVCVDSDGGQDRNTLGNTTKGTKTNQDTCYSETTVIEYFCQNGEIANVKLICEGTKVCVNGRCEEPQCSGKQTGLSGEVWYVVKASSSLKLYDGEMAMIEAGSKKYFIGIDGISGNSTTLVLYNNESEEICDEDMDDGNTNEDLCGKDVEIEVDQVNEEGGYVVLKGKLSYLEVSEQDGTQTTYTGTGCPPNSIDIDSEINRFYPRLDSSLSSKAIKLAGSSYKIVGIDLEDETLTIEISGHNKEISDGEEVELGEAEYTFSIIFNDYGITEIAIEQ